MNEPKTAEQHNAGLVGSYSTATTAPTSRISHIADAFREHLKECEECRRGILIAQTYDTNPRTHVKLCSKGIDLLMAMFC